MKLIAFGRRHDSLLQLSAVEITKATRECQDFCEDAEEWAKFRVFLAKVDGDLGSLATLAGEPSLQLMMLRRLVLASLLLLSIFLASCGGGGGGSSTYTLNLKTDWTNASATNGGQSERIQLFSSTGATLQTLILDAGTGIVNNPFTKLPAGVYHLNIQLFSAAEAAGTEVGVLDVAIDPSKTSTISVVVGGTLSGISVTPNAATVALETSQQFYVQGLTSNGSSAFVVPGSISWSVLGTIGTIDPAAGLFFANSPGSGSVQASQTTTGFVSAGTVQVNSVAATQGTWTIMVYMNAANDLSQYSLVNVEQMQAATSGSAVRTVVQWKQTTSLPYSAQFNSTRRYLISPSTSNSLASQLIQDLGTGIDMGSYQTLNDFVNWSKTYYPAQHYCLIIWDHGNGWSRSPTDHTMAISYDDELGTAIQTWQLSQAIGNNHLDILAYDASLMQMIEVADEVRDKADYIVGSEESPPGAGYPYNLVLNEFVANPNAGSKQLSKAFVDAMVNGYAGNTGVNITQSVLDSTKLTAIDSAVSSLSTALQANETALATIIPTVRANTQTYSQSTTRYYRDLYDLTLNLDADTTIPAVTTADAAVRSAISSAIVWEGHNSNSPNSHGISIDFSPSTVFSSEASDYALLRFATDSTWAAWLAVSP